MYLVKVLQTEMSFIFSLEMEVAMGKIPANGTQAPQVRNTQAPLGNILILVLAVYSIFQSFSSKTILMFLSVTQASHVRKTQAPLGNIFYDVDSIFKLRCVQVSKSDVPTCHSSPWGFHCTAINQNVESETDKN